MWTGGCGEWRCHAERRFWVAAQMPFANFTVGQVFFAVVHDHLRPPLDFFQDAMRKSEVERPILETYVNLLERCWAEVAADRPKFPEIVTELAGMRVQLTQLRLASGPGSSAPGSGSRAAAAIRSPFAQPGSPPATPLAGASPTTSARPPQPPPPPPSSVAASSAAASPQTSQEPVRLAAPRSVQPPQPGVGAGLSMLRSPSFEAQQAAAQQAGQPPAVPGGQAPPPVAPQK